MTLAEYLRGCGYKVVEGAGAKDAFAVLEAGTPVDVIFAEVRLDGDLNGLELSAKIRARYPEIDVVLAIGTAHAADEAANLCDEGPLVRPYHPEELVKRIQKLRERRRTSLAT